MQNKIRRFTVNQLVILFLLFNISCGYSATYFVSNEGSDTNNGKKESPFKSISFAINKLSENDTLYFREGKYYTSKKINLKSMELNQVEKSSKIIICKLKRIIQLVTKKNLTKNQKLS